MRLRSAHVRSICLGAVLTLLLSSCKSIPLDLGTGVEDECKPCTKVETNPTMHALACDLDCLEKHIDKYGSVVAKQPDIWGQARLTKYRDEFEKEMFKDFPNFKESLQGSVNRSDQSYLANATAISAAISGQQAGAIPPPRVLVQNSTAQGTTAVSPSPIAVPDATPNSAVFAGFDSITRNPTRGPLNIGFASMATGGISLEPTIVLDQKARYLDHLNQIRRNNEGDDTLDSPGYSLNLVRVPISVLPGKCTQKGYGAEITMTLTPYISEDLLPTTFRNLVLNDLSDHIGITLTNFLNDKENVKKYMTPEMHFTINEEPQEIQTDAPNLKPQDRMAMQNKIAMQKEIAQALSKNLPSIPKVGDANLRNALFPFPPTQFPDVYGFDFAYHIAYDAYSALHDKYAKTEVLHLPDVQSYLEEEMGGAYNFLTTPSNLDLWEYCDESLAHSIHSRNLLELEKRRTAFQKTVLDRHLPKAGTTDLDHPVHSTTAALAWAILCDSALLNERLIQDIREAASAKGCPPQNAEHLRFCLPDPDANARHVFNEYVRCRWPIHVFALDPYTQDQNLAEAYSRRQEMQLALSLAFASGNMSARNMTRYARRLEEDMETISINRTQVGFSHGEDTFGWRFYPRFQTPEFESNFVSLFRDQLIGGPSKNAEIRQMRLEPGIREGVAIVLMPSFVPYVTCEASSNWFKLTNPKCKEFTLSQAVRLGRVVKSVQNSSANITNANCYRDGDLARLMAKAKQLEARLPLQNMMVQVPYENTLGGFEMFNTGITDLAPELRGWYGGPGINPSGDTQLFLVGDHFSVHHTKVTAGGKDVDFELISRQVMRVTIPKGALVSTRETAPPADDPAKPKTPPAPVPADPCVSDPTVAASSEKPKSTSFKYVVVHIATPYGVSANLDIEVAEPPDASSASPAPTDKKTGLTWNQDSIEIVYQSAPGLGGIGATTTPQVRAPLAIKWDTKKRSTLNWTGQGNPIAYELRLLFAKPYGDGNPKPRYAMPFDETPISVYPIPVDFISPVSVGAAGTQKVLAVPSEVLVPAIMGKFASYFGPKNVNPPVPVQVIKAVLLAKDATGKAIGQPEELSTGLTITWADSSAISPGQHVPLIPTLPPLPVPCPSPMIYPPDFPHIGPAVPPMPPADPQTVLPVPRMVPDAGMPH